MKKINVSKKTTFYNINNEHIIIYDFRKIIFYDSKFLKDIPVYFNLPKGKYYTNNNFIKSRKKLNYIIKRLPFRERNLKKDNYKVMFKYNPNKASIIHKGRFKGNIIIDKDLQNAPLYILDFILFHELGHNSYKTEWKCDLFACREMLRKGYNPSQISLAPIQSLAEINFERKAKVIKSLRNSKK